MRALLAALLLAAPAAQAACRQALVLGLDVSASVDAAEYRLQREGLARALLSPPVAERLLSSPGVPVRLAVFEWSGAGAQQLLLDWTDISDAAALTLAAATIMAAERPQMPPTTGIGAALLYGGALIAEQTECWQLTLDLSTDGPSNDGPEPDALPPGALPAGLVVNALAIGQAGPFQRLIELVAYLNATTIRGPGAFILTARSHADFEEAMQRKLLRELQVIAIGAAEPPLPVSGRQKG